MRPVSIIAAERVIDGVGGFEKTERLERILADEKVEIVRLVIDPLRDGWNTPVEENHFRSGCAPIEALCRAKELIASGRAEVVTITGRDFLRADYTRDERQRLMAIYGDDHPLTEAYTDLAAEFCHLRGIPPQQFERLAALLFGNYAQTWRQAGNATLPGAPWHRKVTSLFRGVDCSNPVVDFCGTVMLASEPVADLLGIPSGERVSLLAAAVAQATGDGPDCLAELARFEHLSAAIRAAEAESGIDIREACESGVALLEAYTCYPVVPLAFLLASGLAPAPEQLPEVLERLSVTVTGGMNLARAAWNNPALNALIALSHLLDDTRRVGIVHGNGGLGYKQGVAVLARGHTYIAGRVQDLEDIKALEERRRRGNAG